MAEPRLIFLAGGGTGGHLYPGLAVAAALQASGAAVTPVFLCTRRDLDAQILRDSGYEFIPQPIEPPLRNVGGLLRFWRSWRETKDLLAGLFDQRRPACVLGLGGYAAGVATRMAAQRGLPAAILNPDVIPGKANRYLLSSVRAVCAQFEATRSHIPRSQRDKLRVTGCPIRAEIVRRPPREQALQRLGLDPRLNTLLVTGASQGAATINLAMVELAGSLAFQGWQLLHLAGKDRSAEVRAGYRERNVAAVVLDFTPHMADVWAVADLAVSRSGASSCAELCVAGVPSVLMPYPYHRDMHQRANARVLADAGAAVLLDDQRDARANAEALRETLGRLLYDADRRRAMSDAAARLARPDAAEAVATAITELLADSR